MISDERGITMKKLILLCGILAVLTIAPTAFAAPFSPTNTTTIGGVAFVPSSLVSVSVISDTTGYCIVATHASTISQSAGKAWGAAAAPATNYDSGLKYVASPASAITCGAAGALPTGTWN